MRFFIKHFSFIVLISLLLTSCYQTKNIPEDEQLYAGIKDLAYGHRWGERKNKTQNDSTGVITAMANAYSAVQGVLSGNGEALQNLSTRDLTKEEKDSIAKAKELDEEASATAKSEINGILAYAPNGSIMGSSKYTHPLTIGLWIWNGCVNSKTWLGRWMFNNFASNPKYISSVGPNVRTQVAKNTLANYGFFSADVRFRLDSVKNPRKKKISYQVLPGKMHRLGKIEYLGFHGTADSLITATASERLLHSGDPFSVPNLSNERDRITTLLRNQGYYYSRSEHITFQADTLQEPYRVQLRIQPSLTLPKIARIPYYIGNTHIKVLKYNTEELTDSFHRRNLYMSWSGGKVKKSPLRYSAIRNFITQKKGELYSVDEQKLMQNQLSNMGIFSSVNVNYVRKDTLSDTLDLYITTMLDKPYYSEFEGKITNKSSGLLGPGVSYSINKRNAFRGSETLSFGVGASYEWQTGADMQGKNSAINSWSLNSNLSLSYPRFMLFGLFRKQTRRLQSTTLFKADVKWENRAGYFGQVSAGVRVKWSFQKNSNILHEFTPVHLEYSQLLNTTHTFDSIMGVNPSLKQSMTDRLVPSMEYSFTWTSPKVKRNINYLNFTTKQATIFQKYTLEYVHKVKLTTRSMFVTRAYLGMIYTYGSQTAPYGDLFTVGGANSIRAFGLRTIGPGCYHPASTGYSYLDQMGDVKFECNLEYRFPIVGNLYGATFIDAGNVWLFDEDAKRPGGRFHWSKLGEQLALGTGVGLRYDLDFLVIRFDVGVGIHAPYDTGRSGYYNMPSFGKSLGYHIAIGYPF